MARIAALNGRRLLAGAGVLGLAALVWWGGPLLVRKSSFFRVRRVDVVGATWLAPERIVLAMQLAPTASIADPVEPLEQRVFAIRGVADVKVTRRLPGVLVVTIDERQPVAYATVDGALWPVDAQGRRLPYDARRGAASLPVLQTPSPGVARVLARLRDAEPTLYDAVTSGWTDGDDVVLATTRGRLRFEAGTRADAMRAVRIVSERLTAEGTPWGELDGRFAGMVIRRGAGA